MFFANYIITVPIQRSILITKLRILQFPSSPFLAPFQFRLGIHLIPKRIVHRLATAKQAQRRAQKENVFHARSVPPHWNFHNKKTAQHRLGGLFWLLEQDSNL